MRCATTKQEFFLIMETLKECWNILLGHPLKVHTDHKNLVCKLFNMECVMHWRLILKEFGPKLIYIKGEQNVVADKLSCMELSEEDFTLDAFTAEDHDFPDDYSLSYKEIAHHQQTDQVIQ